MNIGVLGLNSELLNIYSSTINTSLDKITSVKHLTINNLESQLISETFDLIIISRNIYDKIFKEMTIKNFHYIQEHTRSILII